MKRSTVILALIGAIAVLLSGCTTQQIVNTRQMDAAALEQVASSTETPQQVCETAGLAVDWANKEELDFFAPLHLGLASDNLEQGLKLIKKKETEIEGMKACFKVSKLVENGIAIKAKVKSSLNPVLEELDMLKITDAGNKFSDDILDYTNDVIRLVKKIETGKMDEAMNAQTDLIKEMQALEIEIVMDTNINPVAVMLEKAEDVDADDLAEKTFEKAEKELESAKKFIRANYRNADQVKNTSEAAMRAAKHAFYVAKEVETLKELKPELAEEKVLYIESLLENINQKFNRQSVLGNSLYEQSIIIGERLDALIKSKELQTGELEELKQRQCTTTISNEVMSEPAGNSTKSDSTLVNDEVKSKLGGY